MKTTRFLAAAYVAGCLTSMAFPGLDLAVQPDNLDWDSDFATLTVEVR